MLTDVNRISHSGISGRSLLMYGGSSMHERYEVGASEITELVRDLALKANMLLRTDRRDDLGDAYSKKNIPLRKEAFSDIP